MTTTDYAARKKRMTALFSGEDNLPEAQNSPGHPLDSPVVASGTHLQGLIVIQVLLQDIEIDLHQPRQYLPAELRRTFSSHQISHRDVLEQLMTRAANNDIEAGAYLADIHVLANDIKANGQLYAILVYTNKDRDGRQRYHLIDGERRFWALVYLSSDNGSQVTTIRAEVRADFEKASADEILNMQWSANMQRESVCAMDIAEFVHQNREATMRAIQTDPSLLKRWGDAEAPASPRGAVQVIVCHKLERTFGRPLKRRAYYQYLCIAEHLGASVRPLVRAYKLQLNHLIQIMHQTEGEQMAVVLSVINEGKARTDHPSKPSVDSMKRGRPTRIQSRVSLAERAIVGLNSDTEQALKRWDRDDLSVMLQKDRDLLEATDRHIRMVQTALKGL